VWWWWSRKVYSKESLFKIKLQAVNEEESRDGRTEREIEREHVRRLIEFCERAESWDTHTHTHTHTHFCIRVFITNVKGTFFGMSESEEASKRR